MQWALIATVEQELSYWTKPVIDENYEVVTPTQWVTQIVPVGTVLNLIVYDGESEYIPPEGSMLDEIEDSYAIGDLIMN